MLTLTVTGRRSGREISLPVWFVTEGETLYLVPVHGSDTDWYRNVLTTPAIRLDAAGESLTARATPITDPAGVGKVLGKFGAKYGAGDVAAYYPKQDVAAEVPLA